MPDATNQTAVSASSNNDDAASGVAALAPPAALAPAAPNVPPPLPIGGGGGGIGNNPSGTITIKSPPPPPFPPAAVVGVNPGVSVTVSGSFTTLNISGEATIVIDALGVSQNVTGVNTTPWNATGVTKVGGSLTIVAQLIQQGKPTPVLANASVKVVVNTTAPQLTIATPSNYQEITAPAQALWVPIKFTGTLSDPPGFGFGNNPKLGFIPPIRWVGDWSVSGIPSAGQLGPANTSDGWAHWNVTIQVPPGSHAITFTAEDIGGNTVTQVWNVTVVLPSDIFSTSEQDYLEALLEFATEEAFNDSARVLVSTSGRLATPPTGQNLLNADLVEMLHQPFPELTLDINQNTAKAEVNQLRLAIEVLRKYTNIPSDPVAYWKCNEGAGATTADSSGNGLTGTLVNATWAAAPGQARQALEFDGKTAYVQVGNPPQLKVNSAITIMAWVYPTGPGSDPNETIVNKEGEYGMALGSAGTLIWTFSDTTPIGPIDTGCLVPQNQWTHVAVAFETLLNSITQEFVGLTNTYINGQLKHSYPVSGSIDSVDPNNHDFRIGGRQAVSQFFQGFIDEVKVFSRALNGREVAFAAGQIVLNAGFDASQAQYRQIAYLTLLNQVGTSYDDIRLARAASASDRFALANQLGIDLGPARPDHLDTLFQNASSISEQAIDQIFGLVDTTRTPLSDGAKISDATRSLVQWNFSGVSAGRNTDADGFLYIGIQATNQIVTVFKDAGLTVAVAAGQIATPSSIQFVTVPLSPIGNSSLSGNVIVNFTVDANDIKVSACPSLLAWQLQHLRTLWTAQDFPQTPTVSVSPSNVQPGQNSVAITITGQATSFVQGTTIASFGAGVTVASLVINSATSAIATVNIDPAATVGSRNLTVTTNLQVVNLTNALVIAAAGVPTLVQITPSTSPAGQMNVSVSVIGLATNFVQGTTTANFGTGVAVVSLTVNSLTSATAVLNIDPVTTLGTHDVVLTTGAEVAKLTDGFVVVAVVPAPSPIIDPDLFVDPSSLSNPGLGDFVNPNNNDAAYSLYVIRRSVVQNWIQTLQGLQASGLDAVLSGVLKDSNHLNGYASADILQLDQNRSQGIDISPILAALNLALDAFNYLVEICRIYIVPGSQLLASEWSDVFSILTQTQKIGQFPTWHAVENNAPYYLTLSPDWFQVNTASVTLPAWRATAQARLAWQSVVQGRINQRQTLAQDQENAVDSTEQNTLTILRDALVNAVQVAWVPVGTLFATGLDSDGSMLASGSIDPNWKITQTPSGPAVPAYSTAKLPAGWLSNSDGLSAWISPQADETIGDAPGAYVYATSFDLTGFDPSTVQLVAKVAVDNQITSVVLNGTNLAALTANGFGSFTALAFTNNPLVAFVSGTNTISFSLQNTGAAANPSGLRLEFAITATMPSVNNNWLTQRLFVDIGTNGNQKTTRLDQAVETLQNLFFTLRNEGLQDIPDLSAWVLNPADTSFDSEWAWMGTYAAWQAATTVFLFPQNVLFPYIRQGASLSPPTQAFEDMLSEVTNSAPLDPTHARTIAQDYLSNVQTKEPPTPVLPAELAGVTTSPAGNNAVALTDLIADSQLPARAAQLQTWWQKYDAIAGANRQAFLNYLAEIFYFVPLYLASQLQQAGQFTAALDWYRTIYAYKQQPSQRKIWYGLIAEERLSTTYDQSPTWLIDSLNPHDIVGFGSPAGASGRARAYTRFTLLSIVQCFLAFADSEFSTNTGESIASATDLYLTALNLLTSPEFAIVAGEEKVGQDTALASLTQHAQLNLQKIQKGYNIAGVLEQPLTGTAAVGGTPPTQPAQYSYQTLIDRAKQLVGLAQQIESSFLASLVNLDTELYNDMKAKQDLRVANQNVTLQGLMVTEAQANVTLAQDQQARAQIQVNQYNTLLNSDISTLEQASLGFMGAQVYFQGASALLYASAAVASGVSVEGFLSFGGVSAGDLAQSYSSLSQTFGDTASLLNAQANYEEKQTDWQYQLQTANQDFLIAGQQIQIANDHVSVVTQQQTIASTQATNAQNTLNFLTTQKFTNAVLYQWMSGILQSVYSFFLQQATTVGRMAQTQLAFERQEPPLNVIQADYWQPPSTQTSSNTPSTSSGGPPDTKGLTGAELLLEDIYELDEYAFATNQRKLQITKTISLAQLDPFAFQQFTETGVIQFVTPMALFDTDFPGHYLRLIQQVRTSVIALVPPTQGIRATLLNNGVSRVIVENQDTFSQVVVCRSPQEAALSAPLNASGVFQLDPQQGVLLPFQGLGVDTSWQFEMPRAANPFDYSTIADVLIMIDYTALDSPAYRQEVLQGIVFSSAADRGYSFKQQFADAWYDLNNPNQSDTPMVVQFTTEAGDFPPNVSNLQIQQLLLYFVPKDGASFQISVNDFQFTPQGSQTAFDVGGTGQTTGTISTRRGNAANWVQLIGQTPFGQWQLALPDNNPNDPNAPRNLIANGQITDILFVISYSGQTPPWPD